MRKAIIVDTETTGLPKHPWAEICDLAAVYLEDDQPKHEFQALICPSVLDARCEGAFRVNGLSAELLKREGVRPEIAWGRFAKWLDLIGHRVLTSYNTGFDSKFFPRGLNIYWGPCIMLASHKQMSDDNSIFLQWLPGKDDPKWPKLSEACAHFGVKPCQPEHRALSDARTAAKIFSQLWPATQYRGFDVDSSQE